jgi:hypothetical protein
MEKEASQCTYEDAQVLAKYEGLMPNTNKHSTFVEKLMAP